MPHELAMLFFFSHFSYFTFFAFEQADTFFMSINVHEYKTLQYEISCKWTWIIQEVWKKNEIFKIQLFDGICVLSNTFYIERTVSHYFIPWWRWMIQYFITILGRNIHWTCFGIYTIIHQGMSDFRSPIFNRPILSSNWSKRTLNTC